MMMVAVEDRLAIHELCARYAWYFDRGDAEAWIKLFVPDAQLEVPGKKMQGTEQCMRFAQRMFESTAGKLRHQMTNIFVSNGEEGLASLSAYGMVTDWRDPAKLVMFVSYSGLVTRDDSVWKFVRLTAERL